MDEIRAPWRATWPTSSAALFPRQWNVRDRDGNLVAVIPADGFGFDRERNEMNVRAIVEAVNRLYGGSDE